MHRMVETADENEDPGNHNQGVDIGFTGFIHLDKIKKDKLQRLDMQRVSVRFALISVSRIFSCRHSTMVNEIVVVPNHGKMTFEKLNSNMSF